MNVTVLATEFPSSAWRQAFVRALIRLRPDLNPDAADELSDSAYLHFADLEPIEAARLCSRDPQLIAVCPDDEALAPSWPGTDQSRSGVADALNAGAAARGSFTLGT